MLISWWLLNEVWVFNLQADQCWLLISTFGGQNVAAALKFCGKHIAVAQQLIIARSLNGDHNLAARQLSGNLNVIVQHLIGL